MYKTQLCCCNLHCNDNRGHWWCTRLYLKKIENAIKVWLSYELWIRNDFLAFQWVYYWNCGRTGKRNPGMWRDRKSSPSHSSNILAFNPMISKAIPREFQRNRRKRFSECCNFDQLNVDRKKGPNKCEKKAKVAKIKELFQLDGSREIILFYLARIFLPGNQLDTLGKCISCR